MTYTTVDTFTPYRLRGTLQQSDVGLLWTPPSTRANQVGGTQTTTTTTLLEGLAIGYAHLQNRSGSTGVVGIGARLPNRLWIAGQWDQDAATPFSDDTTDAQDTDTQDFVLESNEANDGYVVAATVKFSAVSLNVAIASVGGSPVRDVAYSNAAGTGWTTLTNLFIQDAATGHYVTGEQLIVFGQMADWGKVATGGLDGVPAGRYALRVRATTAPTTTEARATAIALCQVFVGTEAIADNGTFEYAPHRGELRFPQGNGAVALFETASPGNRATLHVRVLS